MFHAVIKPFTVPESTKGGRMRTDAEMAPFWFKALLQVGILLLLGQGSAAGLLLLPRSSVV